MLHAHGLTLYELADLQGTVPPPESVHLRQIATWAVDFLNAPHDELGRSGSVCPYTAPSMASNSFLLAWAGDKDARSIESTVDRYRQWFMELENLGGKRARLLTIVVVLPNFDRMDSAPLDTLQRRLKDAFVDEGLMVGQFHPHSAEPGLWNEHFRPLRAPIPDPPK